MKEVCFNTEKILEDIASNGSEKAFRQLFDLYYPKMLHLAFSILKNNDIAQDAVLEVFEKVWDKRADLTKIQNITKYLFVSVKNNSITKLRQRKELVALEMTESNIMEKVIHQHPENILLNKELSDKINEAVLNLPEKCRLVYRLIKEDGLKYQEASDLLNLSPKTIDNHLSNAMYRIRQSVTSYLYDNKKKNWRVLKSIVSILTI